MAAFTAGFIRRKEFRAALKADFQKPCSTLTAKLFCFWVFSPALRAFHLFSSPDGKKILRSLFIQTPQFVRLEDYYAKFRLFLDLGKKKTKEASRRKRSSRSHHIGTFGKLFFILPSPRRLRVSLMVIENGWNLMVKKYSFGNGESRGKLPPKGVTLSGQD